MLNTTEEIRANVQALEWVASQCAAEPDYDNKNRAKAYLGTVEFLKAELNGRGERDCWSPALWRRVLLGGRK